MYLFCLEFWAECYVLNLQPLLGADEVSGQPWQLITAIHDEGERSDSLCMTLIRV